MTWTNSEYEIKFVVCPRCGDYMLIKSVSTSKHGIIITYLSACGYTLDLVSRIQHKKGK